MLFSDLKVQAGLMTETEMKRIEFMMRVMSSHQVFFYLVTIYGYHKHIMLVVLVQCIAMEMVGKVYNRHMALYYCIFTYDTSEHHH